MDANGAATAVSSMTSSALADMTGRPKLGLKRVVEGPPHVAQLGAVFAVASEQAWHIANGTAVVERDADLWRLREPGFLRDICDGPLPQPSSTLALAPVLGTWLVLGAAEALYLGAEHAADIAQRPSFFAYWLDQPLYRGPLVLSALIVVTVVLMMARYSKSTRARDKADQTDRIAQKLEADLLRPLVVLRSALPPASGAEQNRQLAVELATAARRFGGASERLSGSVATVEQFGAAIGRLLDGLPHLGAHATRLAEIEQRIGESAETMADAVRPVTALVEDVSRTAATAATAADRAAGVLDRSTAQLAEARSLGVVMVDQRTAATAAEQPFTAAATLVESAARGLEDATKTLHRTSEELRATIHDVNWLAMVADGLRSAESGHGGWPSTGSDDLVDLLPEPEEPSR